MKNNYWNIFTGIVKYLQAKGEGYETLTLGSYDDGHDDGHAHAYVF